MDDGGSGTLTKLIVLIVIVSVDGLVKPVFGFNAGVTLASAVPLKVSFIFNELSVVVSTLDEFIVVELSIFS